MAGFLFGACSSDDVVVGDGGQDGAVVVQPGEEGFLSMSINLPTTVGVKRAAGYDDGTPDEYQVNSAKLLVFSGESEAAATLHRVYDLDVSAFTKTTRPRLLLLPTSCRIFWCLLRQDSKLPLFMPWSC